jgi:hypothetical protein
LFNFLNARSILNDPCQENIALKNRSELGPENMDPYTKSGVFSVADPDSHQIK